MVTPLGRGIQFFKEFGLFDVVLPFLLVFAIVFAILEKTMILGKEGDLPKRALNAMVSFVVAMLVVATNKIVNAINLALPNVVLLIVFLVVFVMLVGFFYTAGEFNFAEKHSKWTAVFIFLVFIGVVLIFLDAIRDDDGVSWLDEFVTYIMENFSGAVVGSIVFLGIAILSVMWIMGGFASEEKKKEKG